MTFLNLTSIFYECCLYPIIMNRIQISIKKSFPDGYSTFIAKHQVLLFNPIYGWKTALTQDFLHDYCLAINTCLYLGPTDVLMVLI